MDKVKENTIIEGHDRGRVLNFILITKHTHSLRIDAIRE